MRTNNKAVADLPAGTPTLEQIYDLLDVLEHVRIEVEAIEYLRYHALNNLRFSAGEMNNVNAINAAAEACIEKAKDYITQIDARVREILSQDGTTDE